MKLILESLGYNFDDEYQIWIRSDYKGISYIMMAMK